ncbi:MAG: hypothetical protein JSW27_23050 [Phycisphaerales bacterium]|nr:MAG: hypothetical protein JSW27_23050 [Phycisphaerales bacterium]
MGRLRNGTRRATIMVMVALTATAGWAAGPARPGADRVLRLTPADALFCLRINNLDKTLSEASAFLTGIAPEGFDAKAMALGKLTGMLGAERMEQVRQRGSFAVYGAMPPSGENQGPMGNLFVGVLVPVKDYDAFVGEDKPDQDGIATLTVDGQPRIIATQFGRYALLARPNARDNIVQVRKMMRDRQAGLRSALSEGERTLSAESPIWLYGNVQKAAAIIKPMVLGKLEQVKGELKKAAERQESPIEDPEGIIRFYAALLNIVTSEMASVAVGLAPSAEACTMTLAFKAVPGTDMEMMMTPASQPSNYRRTLPYLRDGAILNVAAAVDPEIWEKSYQCWIELIPQLIAGDIPESDLDQMRQLTTKSFRAMGDAISFSFQPGENDDGVPFSMQYVIEVTDGATIEKAIAEELELTNSEVFTKIFENFGFNMSAQIASETTTYKGVRINAARVAFEFDAGDSPQGQMIQRIWGSEGLQYRWGVVDGKCVYTVGPDAEADAHKLIDRIQAGVPTDVCSEMKAAIAALPEGGQVEAVGTLNYVRVLNAFVGMMPLPDGKQLPELNVPTESSIAFAAGTMADVPVAWVVLPRQHLMEIKSAFKTLEEKTK